MCALTTKANAHVKQDTLVPVVIAFALRTIPGSFVVVMASASKMAPANAIMGQ